MKSNIKNIICSLIISSMSLCTTFWEEGDVRYMSVTEPMILKLSLKPNEQVRRDSKEYAFLVNELGLPMIEHFFEECNEVNKVKWTRFFNSEFEDTRTITSTIPISFQGKRITEGAQYESLLDRVSENDLTFTLIEGIENEAKFRIGNLGVVMSDSWILRNPIGMRSGIFRGGGYECYYTFCNDVLLTSCSVDIDTMGMIMRQIFRGHTLAEYVPVPWGCVHNLIVTRFAPNRYLFGKEKKVDTKLYLSQDSVVSFDMADIQLPFGLGKHIRLDSNGLGTISSRDLRKIPLLLENIKGLMNLNSDFEIYVREVPQHCPVYSEGMNDESRDYKRYAWFSIKKTALSSIEPVKGELLIPGTILYNAAAEILDLPKTSEQFTSGGRGTFYKKTTKMMGKEISYSVKAIEDSFDSYFMSNLCNEEAIVRKTAAFYKYFLARFGPWIDIVCEGCIGDEYVFSIDKLAYKYLSIISCVVDVKIVKLESIEFLSMFHPNPALLVFTDDLAWTEDSSGTRIATMLRSGEFTEYVHEEYEMTIEQRRIIYRNGLFMMLIYDKTTRGTEYGNKNLHPYSRT